MRYTVANARELLQLADVFCFDSTDEIRDEHDRKCLQTLNMNDVWGWALAWGEYVSDDELPEVARLYDDYGECGLLYWVSEKNHQMRSEFHDVNRKVEFVRQEEKINNEYPDPNKRAYKNIQYTLGADAIDKTPTSTENTTVET